MSNDNNNRSCTSGPQRREVLRVIGGTGVALPLAGCLGMFGDDDPADDSDAADDSDDTADDDPGDSDPFFEVRNLNPRDATLTAGDYLQASATIINSGGSPGTQTIELRIDGERRAAEELMLEGESATVLSFEQVSTEGLSGEHTFGIYSADDSDEGTLSIEGWFADARWHRNHNWPMDADGATNWDNYEVHDLGEETSGELMAMDIDPEGRVWYIGRGAPFVAHGDETTQICYVNPDSGEHTVALELDVIVGAGEVTGGNARELGGQSVAIDPDFEENGFVYIYYHPSSENFDLIENPYDADITTMLQRVSRFEMNGDTLDPNSEQVVLEIPLQLETCCHIGGYMEFGPTGDLYISTGDDSNNVGAPDGEVNWSMTDEREGEIGGRPAPVSDAQRTSGNTADLRGSILRITPEDDGSYSIPDGNLKEWWEDKTGESYSEDEFLPELYVMGLRNPFTFTVDEHTGFIFVSDYGNDASHWDDGLGTVGQATHHLFDTPGNAGYPFFKGYYPNRQYDFEQQAPGQPFWIDHLRNRSRNNTGIEHIPGVTAALIWHPQSFNTYTEVAAWADMPRPGEITWPELDAGGSADAGVAYRYSEDFGPGALDPYFEGKQFFMNPSNADNIRYLTYNENGSLEIDDFLPNNSISNAYDMGLLPDGRLVIMGMRSGIHVVEYLGDPPALDAASTTPSSNITHLSHASSSGSASSTVDNISAVTADDGIPTGSQFWSFNNLFDDGYSNADLIQLSADAGLHTYEVYMIDDAEEMLAVQEETGVYMSSAHIGISDVENDPEGLVDTYEPFAHEGDYPALIDPYHGGGGFWNDEDDVIGFAERVNNAADVMADYGFEFGYHNHDFEFQYIGDEYAYDIFAQEVEDHVHLQLDTAWVLAGEGRPDPIDFIVEYGDKIRSLHMKNWEANDSSTHGYGSMGNGSLTEIHEGDLNMRAIATAARNASNVDYLIYEWDNSPQPYESFEYAGTYLNQVNHDWPANVIPGIPDAEVHPGKFPR